MTSANAVVVHCLFGPDFTAPERLLQGLCLDLFTLAYAPATRSSGPFAGDTAERVNSAEHFFADAVAAVAARALVIPNPFGPGTATTSDSLACPSTPWDTVPLYLYRFHGAEPFYFIKRGLSWCTDLGLYFPRRQLLVSFQTQAKRVAQDRADVEHALQFFDQHEATITSVQPGHRAPDLPCVLVTSSHFAHHLWNELSVIEGLVAAGLHDRVRYLVHRQPLAPLAALFPDIPPEHIVDIDGATEAPYLRAMRQSWFVAPCGRRYIPPSLITRILACAADTFPATTAAVDAFRRAHEFVVWITIRLDARTATNLIQAVSEVILALLRRYPGLGVVFDGHTLATGEAPGEWSGRLNDDERTAIASIVARVGRPFGHVILSGTQTMNAFLWTQIADFYVCPYGTAHHKIAWLHPVSGVVHVGENKRPVAAAAASLYARQEGPPPDFFYGVVTRADGRDGEHRTDLFSYELDVPSLVDRVLAGVTALPEADR